MSGTTIKLIGLAVALAAAAPHQADLHAQDVPVAEATAVLRAVAEYMLIDTPAESYSDHPTARSLAKRRRGDIAIALRIDERTTGQDPNYTIPVAGQVVARLRSRGIDAVVIDPGAVNRLCPMVRVIPHIAERHCSFPPSMSLILGLSYPRAEDNHRLSVSVSSFTDQRTAEGSPVRSNLTAIVERVNGEWIIVDVRPLVLR